MTGNEYIAALNYRWLTPLYDALVEGPMSVMRMRQGLLVQLGDLRGKSVLDVGCGTGTFAIMLQRAWPDAAVTGLDGDPQILEIARAKARRLELDVRFTEAMSDAMPYPDGSFDYVVTSLMLHHLASNTKQATALEIYRVLRSGGALLGLDFAEPRGPVARGLTPLTRHFERVAENLDGLLPVLFKQAGFVDYVESQRYVLGSIALFHASKPSALSHVS